MQTYDEILNSMTQKYTELSGITPDERSDIAIRLRVLAGEIFSTLVNMEWLKRQMFLTTAEGEYLDLHAKERGITRRGGTRATGTVTFSVSEAATEDISIPKGTVVACPVSLLRFETTADAVIKKGAISIGVKAQSTNAGKEYNVLSDTVTVMVTPPSGVEAVSNPQPFIGGCDRETDESLRQRIEDSIKFPANSTNCAYYESVALGVQGVSSAQAVPRGRGAGTVDVYIAADGVAASDSAVTEAQSVLSTLREVNVDVLVKKAESRKLNVYIDIDVYEGYDFDEVRARCVSALTDYIGSRGVGGEVLMCRVSECVYHIDGVKELRFVDGVNRDYRKIDGIFPVAGTIHIERIEL